MSAFFNFKADTTVYMRCAKHGASEGAVGRPFEAMKEAYYGQWCDRLYLIEYNDLVTNPASVLRRLYEVIGEPFFAHDFNNVEMSFDAFDRQMGMPGLHKVGREVRWTPRGTILPPDLFNRYRNESFWTGRHQQHAAREVA
jgi:sulfotransferase